MAIEWIKISTNIFEDDKIKLLKNSTKSKFNNVIVVWFRLICLAGKQNNKGFFYLSEDLPLTLEMFSTLFETPINQLEFAFNEFIKLKMLGYKDGVYFIKNWDKHQSLDKYEEKKKRDRERIARKRELEKKQDVAQDVADMSQVVSPTVAPRREEKRKEENRIDYIKEEIEQNTSDSLNYDLNNCLTGEDLKERSLWCYLYCKQYNNCHLPKTQEAQEAENKKLNRRAKDE